MDPISELLSTIRTIAVIGCSPKPHRDSHRVASYMQRQGYRIVPVNPGHDRILGERCFPDLGAIPADVEVELVDVFRRSEHVAPIIDASIERPVAAVWLQLGISDPEAETRGREAGLVVVTDRCLMVEHRRRYGG